MMRVFILTACFVLVTVQLAAQNYIERISKDDLNIEYKWRKQHLLKKDSPYVLYLKISNTGIDRCQVGFELLFYWNATLHSRSGRREYCLKPGQKIHGKTWDLVFQSNIKTMEEIDDPMFLWEIDSLEIRRNADCETGLKFSLEPKHESAGAK